MLLIADLVVPFPLSLLVLIVVFLLGCKAGDLTHPGQGPANYVHIDFQDSVSVSVLSDNWADLTRPGQGPANFP